jgi:hypothetical protein
MATKRAALYVRVSTDKQTVENQVRELTAIAQRRGWEVVATYSDAGISGPRAASTAQAWIRCSRTRAVAGLRSLWRGP